MNKKIFFTHIRDQNRHGVLPKGGCTLGWTRDLANDRILITMSRCSPKDHYNRAAGRAIVTERMEKLFSMTNEQIIEMNTPGTTTFDGNVGLIPGNTVREAAKIILNRVVVKGFVPASLDEFNNRFIESLIMRQGAL